jgi:hypothetical protein
MKLENRQHVADVLLFVLPVKSLTIRTCCRVADFLDLSINPAFLALQSVRITQFREDCQRNDCHGNGKKSLQIIPLTNIPLTVPAFSLPQPQSALVAALLYEQFHSIENSEGATGSNPVAPTIFPQALDIFCEVA